MTPLEARDGFREHLSPEEGKRLAPLSDFILSLVKSMLRTGYYTAGHPESVKSLRGLHSQLTSLMEGKKAITFVVRKTRDSSDVLVDGVLDEPLMMTAITPRGPGMVFAQKFAEFFDRKYLLSVTIKSSISREHFAKFIEIVTRPKAKASGSEEGRDSSEGEVLPGGVDEGEPKDDFTKELHEAGVFEITVVFNDERIGIGRQLIWWIEVVLSRLNKDLQVIPLLKNATPEEQRRHRDQLFDDIVRPMKQPENIKSVLVNLDVIKGEAAGGIDLESEILRRLGPALLGPTVELLVREMDERAGDLALARREEENPQRLERIVAHHEYFIGRIRNILAKCARILGKRRKEEDEGAVILLHKKGLITFGEIPRWLRDKIVVRELADDYIEMGEEFTGRLARPPSPEKHAAVVAQSIRLFRELLGRRLFRELRDIVEILKRQAAAESELRLNAAKGLEKIARIDVLEAMGGDFGELDWDKRKSLVDLLSAIGPATAGNLIGLLRQSEERAERRRLLTLLIGYGRAAVQPVLDELGNAAVAWRVKRNMLTLLVGIEDLGESADKAAVAARRHLHHGDYRVRIEAYAALFKILGKEAEPYLLHGLEDVHPAAKSKAVDLLGRLRSTDPKLLEWYIGVLNKRGEFEKEAEEEKVQVHAVHALGNLGNFKFTNGTSESFFIYLLQKEGLKLFARRKGKSIKKTKATGVRAAICDVLGKIGGPASVKTLREITKEGDSELRPHAERALRKIEARRG